MGGWESEMWGFSLRLQKKSVNLHVWCNITWQLVTVKNHKISFLFPYFFQHKKTFAQFFFIKINTIIVFINGDKISDNMNNKYWFCGYIPTLPRPSHDIWRYILTQPADRILLLFPIISLQCGLKYWLHTTE